jgi:hypothetical protein
MFVLARFGPSLDLDQRDIVTHVMAGVTWLEDQASRPAG